MNLDPDRINELVLIFSKLDDEYQTELMKQAYVLSLKQSQKNLIKNENIKFINNNDYEDEINRRSNATAKEMLEIIDIMKQIGDNEKAELMLLLNKLGGRNTEKKTDIEIKINQKSVPMKDYLKEILPLADFEIASKNLEKHLKKLKEE